MKRLYKELNQILPGSYVIELKDLSRMKDLKAPLLAKFSDDIPYADAVSKEKHAEVDDRRIKAFVADIDRFRELAPAVRLLKTYVPDVKIFAAGADMANIPEICTGFLQTDPEEALFAKKNLQDAEGIAIDSSSAAALAAAVSLAKKEDYAGINILVLL